jgi:hypothetical protein
MFGFALLDHRSALGNGFAADCLPNTLRRSQARAEKNITFGRALLYVAKAGDSQILGLCCTGKLKNNLAAF